MYIYIYMYYTYIYIIHIHIKNDTLRKNNNGWQMSYRIWPHLFHAMAFMLVEGMLPDLWSYRSYL